jgi:putative SOS response-associated peptidase YedK
MCNLYSMMRSRDEMRRLFKVGWDRTGNQPPLPAIFPDQLAPVVRINGKGERGIEMMRWGFPPPPNLGSRSVTNVRNTSSSYWRGWLKPERRCLVPATSFCEYQDGNKTPTWFALGQDRPLFAFAGIWRPWTGAKGTKAERLALTDLTGSDVQEHFLFAFLTAEPNDLVRPVHSKAMPVILTGEDCDTWLEADTPIALQLQHPFPADRMAIVATGPRKDEAA